MRLWGAASNPVDTHFVYSEKHSLSMNCDNYTINHSHYKMCNTASEASALTEQTRRRSTNAF